MDKWTDGDMNNTEALRRTHTDHYVHVRSKVPLERLLNFHLKDGWQPFCEFLGKAAQNDEVFPRVNEAVSTVRLHYLIVVIRLWHIGRKYLTMVAVAGIAYLLALAKEIDCRVSVICLYGRPRNFLMLRV
jgi:hypothetical protein